MTDDIFTFTLNTTTGELTMTSAPPDEKYNVSFTARRSTGGREFDILFNFRENAHIQTRTSRPLSGFTTSMNDIGKRSIQMALLRGEIDGLQKLTVTHPNRLDYKLELLNKQKALKLFKSRK